MIAATASTGMLLDICADESQSLDTREFAVLWIGKYYPEFMYVIANPTRKQKKVKGKMIVDANAWWKVHGGTPEMKKRILLSTIQAGVVKENKNYVQSIPVPIQTPARLWSTPFTVNAFFFSSWSTGSRPA